MLVGLALRAVYEYINPRQGAVRCGSGNPRLAPSPTRNVRNCGKMLKLFKIQYTSERSERS